MEYAKYGKRIVLKLGPGEEVVSSVIEVCEKEKISLASVSGIGAAKRLKAGYFDVKEKTYFVKDYAGNLEIVSLLGSITHKGGKPYAHLHVAFALESGALCGGHLSEAVIGGAGEIFIDCARGSIARVYDETIGLNVMEF